MGLWMEGIDGYKMEHLERSCKGLEVRLVNKIRQCRRI